MIDVSELYGERQELLDKLDEVITYKKNVGRLLARSEHAYKKARTLKMAEAMLIGYTCEHGTTKPVAATAVNELVQGDSVIADLRLQRDLHMADAEVTQEKIYALKLQINILTTDIENVRRMV